MSIPDVQKAIEQTPSSYKNLNLEELINLLQYTGDIKDRYLDKIKKKVRSVGFVNPALTATQVVKCPIFKATIINIIYDHRYIDARYDLEGYIFIHRMNNYGIHYPAFYHYFQYLSEKIKMIS